MIIIIVIYYCISSLVNIFVIFELVIIENNLNLIIFYLNISLMEKMLDNIVIR